MTGYIIDKNGSALRLPELTGWDIRHVFSDEADSFSITLPYGGVSADAMYSACRFRAEHGGETVFTGVVDEYELTAAQSGAVISINGRGLAALLMDNEALPARYWGAGLEVILENHVYPCGITDVRTAAMSTASRLDVSAGDSQWRVLGEFCRFCGSVRPWFDRRGTLMLDGSGGDTRAVNADAITAQSFTDRRYGVISSVTVYNRGMTAQADNAQLLARGGSARRVVTVPRKTAYDAMRYAGSYQIAESARGATQLCATLPEPFAAFAGDTVTLSSSPLGFSGGFTVTESRCRADGSGVCTELTLIKEE